MFYVSFLTLRGSVALSEKSTLNPAASLQKSWKSWLSAYSLKVLSKRRPIRMHNSSYREATDIILIPSDAKLNKLYEKIRPNKNEFRDFEQSQNDYMKVTKKSVSRMCNGAVNRQPGYRARNFQRRGQFRMNRNIKQWQRSKKETDKLANRQLL